MRDGRTARGVSRPGGGFVAARALGLCLAGLLSVMGACRTRPVRTILLAEIHSKVAIECVVLRATTAEGTTLEETVPRPRLRTDFADAKVTIAVYPGKTLHGTITLQALGVRGGKAECDGPTVATSDAVEATFVDGETVTVSLTLETTGTDADGDGWEASADCDDGDAQTYPGAPEICGDDLDQSCVGTPDLGCPCEPTGISRSCYPRGLDDPQVTRPNTTCHSGVQRCEAWAWGVCEGAVLPAEESCDGIDTDCDGMPDPEGCPCVDNQTRPCFTFDPPEAGGVGECRMGISTCHAGTWGTCFGDTGPSREICNGLDDDCDGTTDDPEDIPREFCEETRGVCGLARKPCGSNGTEPCSEAEYRRAAGGTFETDETLCDGLDNDCDGLVDEVCACDPSTEPERPCFPFGQGMDDPAVGQGPCVAGQQVCRDVNKTWGACQGAVVPTSETCNGVDDDCNGVIDDVIWEGQPCTASAVGLCAEGTLHCDPSVAPDGKVCLPAAPVEPDPACDGLDADCDSTEDPANDDRDAECGAGRLCCAGTCVDPQSDPAHCGDCYAACPDDGAPCHDPACVDGACTYAPWQDNAPCPDDGATCTSDLCQSGTCTHEPLPDGTPCDEGGGTTVCEAGACVRGCHIDGVFYNPGARNPANECQGCRPDADAFAWTNLGASTTCSDDGNPCTRDVCSAATASCTHPARADGAGCGTGRICVRSSKTCVAGCFIQGTFRTPDERDPSNECQSCQPQVSTSTWSPLPSSASCSGDGRWCTVGDHCDGNGQCVGGAPRDCSGASSACTTGTCNESTDHCDAVPKSQGTACTTSLGGPGVCDAQGGCFDGCEISGALHATGTHPGSNLCKSCDPSRDRHAWSNEAPGTPCQDGSNCTVGDTCGGAGQCTSGPSRDCTAYDGPCAVGQCYETQPYCRSDPKPTGTFCSTSTITAGVCDARTSLCVRGCFINTTLYAAGDLNPNNECQFCNPDLSRSTWSNRNVGSCQPGPSCQCIAGQRTEMDCSNQIDDDGDGTTDCADRPECDTQSCGTGCVCNGSNATETICLDHIDNDYDGPADCSDPDCDGQSCGPGCTCAGGGTTETLCSDNIDNDQDGSKDCADSDCVGRPCGVGRICSNSGTCQ